MQKINDKLYNWASIIDPNTLEQARTTSTMPFIYPHVALMPDAHLGKGSTVGSVIPTMGAIMPAAVGVDIGCFTGDTKIPLLDGTQKSLKELTEAGEPVYVYSLNESLNIVVGEATPKLTRNNAELMEVVISGGETIRCTPDHQFMMLDGSYKEAKDLEVFNSLMPLYRSYESKDGYEHVKTSRGTGIATHKMVAEQFLEKKNKTDVVHYKDIQWFNNTPENLIYLTPNEHSKYHRGVKECNTHWHSKSFDEKRVEALHNKATTKEGHEYYSERGTKNIKSYMENNHDQFLASVADNGERGKRYLVKYNTSEEGKAKSSEIANRMYSCEICGVEVKGGLGLHQHRKSVHGTNHKVLFTKKLDIREDVYCLTVPQYGNFALAAGVFVHNCGMIAVRTQFSENDLERHGLPALRHSIERSIPLSKGGQNQQYTATARTRIVALEKMYAASGGEVKFLDKLAKDWRLQLGSLGSGNHFIEISLDEAKNVWLFLHSGSRGIGNKLATHHIAIAQKLMKQYFISLPDKDLSYLSEGTPEFDSYIRDLNWAQQFALYNREEMMDRVIKDFSHWIGTPIQEQERINCHHNFTTKRQIFGKNVWLSRKGAIEATEGKMGLIPGSMGTASYVVEGKGNPMSLSSAPHGAGRVYSRGKARETFTVEQLRESMKGIEYRNTDAFIDEIPAAYKDVDVVMKDAEDLVYIRHTLRQIVNVKGD